jgi:hypothetical protein
MTVTARSKTCGDRGQSLDGMVGARSTSRPTCLLSEGRRCGSASAVHEPSFAGPPYPVSSSAPAGPSARTTPPRRSPESSTARVRLHLKPGQKSTKQLLEQYSDRLICVRYRYHAQRRKRFKTEELLVAERIGNRHCLASPSTRSSGYASPLPTW